MDDYYLVDDEGGFSDGANEDSSDEDDQWLQHFMRIKGHEEPSFDQEMEIERDTRRQGFTCDDRPSSTGGIEEEKADPKGMKKEKRASEDDDDNLFYDPVADDEDEKWAERKRNEYLCLPSGRSTSSGISAAKVTESDAVLNCPGCMTLLCMDCQRHEVYKTQYRAMFSFNCRVDFGKKLQPKSSKRKGVTRRMGKEEEDDDEDHDGAGSESSKVKKKKNYYETRCCVCNTQVAVYDDHEVYHFFNVLSSFT